MKKYRIEAQLTLTSTGTPVTEWLEDAHLTKGLDPADFARRYTPAGQEKLRDLGYTEREVAAARFVMQPAKLDIAWRNYPHPENAA